MWTRQLPYDENAYVGARSKILNCEKLKKILPNWKDRAAIGGRQDRPMDGEGAFLAFKMPSAASSLRLTTKNDLSTENWSIMKYPLIRNNFNRDDLDAVINLLKQDDPPNQWFDVQAFEAAWSSWLGVKFSVFVNSGSSANLLSMALQATLPSRW